MSVKNAIESAMKQAKASLAISGMELSEQQERLVLMRTRGFMTHDEFIRLALRMAKGE